MKELAQRLTAAGQTTDPNTVTDWEKDRVQEPDADKIKLIADWVGLPVEALLTGAGFPSIEAGGVRAASSESAGGMTASSRHGGAVREPQGEGYPSPGFGIAQHALEEFARLIVHEPAKATRQLTRQVTDGGMSADDVLEVLKDYEQGLADRGYNFPAWLRITRRELEALRARSGPQPPG